MRERFAKTFLFGLILSLWPCFAPPASAQATFVPSRVSDIPQLARWMKSSWMPGYRIVGTRPNSGLSGTATTTTGVTTHVKVHAPYGAHQIRLVYAAIYAGGNGDVALPNREAFKASIEYPWNSGTRYPVTFQGQRTLTVDGGGYAVTDPAGVDVPAGDDFGVYTYVTTPDNPGTDIYPRGFFTNSLDGEWTKTNGDATDSGTATANAVTSGVWPYEILGIPDTFGPTIAVSGDSIGAGSHNGNDGQSALVYALGGNFPYVNVAKSSELTTDYMTTKRNHRSVLASTADYFVTNYATNDFGTNDLTTVKANLIDIWKCHYLKGQKVYQETILPKNSSSDHWTTVVGQSISNSANETERQQLNQWLRAPKSAGAGNSALVDGAPYLTGIFDTAQAVEVNADGTAIQINASTGAISNGVGGYWAIPTSASYNAYTANAGVSSSAGVFTDSRQTWTTNAYVNFTIKVTSGTNNGLWRVITANTGTTLTLNNAFPTPCDSTTVYEIWGTNTDDGTHPLFRGYVQCATAINTALFK